MAVCKAIVNFNSFVVSKVTQSLFLGDDFCNLMSFSPVHQEFSTKPDIPTTRDGFFRPLRTGIHVSEVNTLTLTFLNNITYPSRESGGGCVASK